MSLILILVALLAPAVTFAQKLPGHFTCRDLIDSSNGKLSHTDDGGRAYVPINVPRPRDAFGQALLAHDTYLCRRFARGEISVSEFDVLHAEKVQQINRERHKAVVGRKNWENQERTIQNQRAMQTQQETVQVQREAVQVQRNAAVIQVRRVETPR